jgi:hypothetical protein
VRTLARNLEQHRRAGVMSANGTAMSAIGGDKEYVQEHILTDGIVAPVVL